MRGTMRHRDPARAGTTSVIQRRLRALRLASRVLHTAITRLAMNLALRTGSPVRVTSVTSTMPRPVVTSTRRPARVAMIS